ncbi:MAG: MATE family efflux transporter [Ruminococcaceae bacterium]|jgi:putative MATE family efflux protein|nr:MATE family efflux transporter [Oscillospiraceae bacterium]
MNFRRKYIGDRAFYRMLFILVLPLIIQQGITNFVSLLDNLMVGGLGTLPMSAVSIVNQLIFVFNLAIFGGLSGASIFGTQFFGLRDWQGMRDTFRVKLVFSVVVSAAAVTVFLLFGDSLMMLFLKGETNTPEEIARTVAEARSYLSVAVIGLLPFALVQTYAGTMRETGETVGPMTAGLIAIFVNLIFNYLLIYGKFGFPEMGVKGAAVATVLSRLVETAYVVAQCHRRHKWFRFIEGVYRRFRIPAALVKRIAVTGTPLLVNEILWSLGMTFINRNYSLRGITVIAATNIAGTVWNLFCVIMFAMGSAVSILVGQRLGAGDREGAIDVNNKLIFFTIVSHVAVGGLLVAAAPFIPRLYNVEPEVRAMASSFLMIAGAAAPIHAFIHVIYFAIRSGGKTFVTFLFDSVYTWVVPASLSFILCRFTGLGIVPIYFAVQFIDVVKLFIGVPLLRSGFWANRIVEVSKPEDEGEDPA